MDSGDLTLKRLSKIALVALGVLVAGALFFYKERMFFADDAYYLFKIINTECFRIEYQRYGSFITQIIPYCGEKLHLPLKAIIVGYSVSFNLFYFAVACLLVYKFRQYGLAILMALYYFLFISEAYFWTNNEVHQAVAWMFLLWGATLYSGHKKVQVPFILLLFAILAFFTIFTHFVVLIPTTFIGVYLIIEKKNWPFSKNTSIMLGIITALIIGLKYISSTSPSSYDNNHLYGITHFSIQDIINTFTSPVVLVFAQRCFTNYWVAILLIMASVATLMRCKKNMLAAWTFISVVGYFIIMGLTYGDQPGDILLFHIESEWASISIIVAAGFVFSYLPGQKVLFATCLLAAIFAIRSAYILAALPSFTRRNEANERILMQMRKKGITKLALINDERLLSINKLSWALPYESLMMSAISGDKPQLSYFFVNNDDKKIQELVKKSNGFYDNYNMMQPAMFNQRYFSIDTACAYQVMTYKEFMK